MRSGTRESPERGQHDHQGCAKHGADNARHESAGTRDPIADGGGDGHDGQQKQQKPHPPSRQREALPSLLGDPPERGQDHPIHVVKLERLPDVIDGPELERQPG